MPLQHVALDSPRRAHLAPPRDTNPASAGTDTTVSKDAPETIPTCAPPEKLGYVALGQRRGVVTVVRVLVLGVKVGCRSCIGRLVTAATAPAAETDVTR